MQLAADGQTVAHRAADGDGPFEGDTGVSCDVLVGRGAVGVLKILEDFGFAEGFVHDRP
jgi:hypothetical protein